MKIALVRSGRLVKMVEVSDHKSPYYQFAHKDPTLLRTFDERFVRDESRTCLCCGAARFDSIDSLDLPSWVERC